MPPPSNGPAARGFLKIPWCIVQDTSLSPSEKLVFSTILSLQGHSPNCTPRIAKLASLTGLSAPTVKRSIATLKLKRLLNVLQFTDQNGFRHNSYSVPKHLHHSLNSLSSHTPSQGSF